MTPPLCFTCGQPTEGDPFANRLPTGAPCPTCRERALDALPSLLPRTAPESDGVEEEPVRSHGLRALPHTDSPWGPDDYDDPPIGA